MPSRARTIVTPDLAAEFHHWAAGARLVAGVDECGRGPLSGPVVAGAVVLAPTVSPACFAWARDSKVLSTKRITQYATAIREGCYDEAGLLAWGLGAASVREIDQWNILRATARAMARALTAVERRLRVRRLLAPGEGLDMVLVDGTPMRELERTYGRVHEAIPKGDARSLSIACASILAKHCRDTLMHRLAARHPAFACWAKDVGYGSPAHLAALRAHGPLPGHHRMSFRPVAEAASAGASAMGASR